MDNVIHEIKSKSTLQYTFILFHDQYMYMYIQNLIKLSYMHSIQRSCSLQLHSHTNTSHVILTVTTHVTQFYHFITSFWTVMVLSFLKQHGKALCTFYETLFSALGTYSMPFAFFRHPVEWRSLTYCHRVYTFARFANGSSSSLRSSSTSGG